MPVQSPYRHLTSSPHILNIIFHYHIFNIATDPKWGIRQLIDEEFEVDDVDTQYMVTRLEMGHPDWQFLMVYGHCVSFWGIRRQIEDMMPDDEDEWGFVDRDYASLILNYCRDRYHKPLFSYVDLCDLNFNYLFDCIEVQWLRGIDEIDLGGMHVPELYFENPDFRLPTESETLFESIRGIKKLNHDTITRNLNYDCFASLRGIQDLSLHGLYMGHLQDDAFENLRGIQKFYLSDFRFTLSPEIFRNLRGLKEFTVLGSFSFDCLEEDAYNLRGIQKLIASTSEDFVLTDKCFESFRGIEVLVLVKECHYCEHHPSSLLTNASFQNLRGVRILKLSTCSNHDNITDSAFMNLRGVKTLDIKNFPKITCAIFKNLRGIERLELKNCRKIRFTADSLYNLRGIHHLNWKEGFHTVGRSSGKVKKPLTEDSLKQLNGVQYLCLDGVVTVCDEAFHHFGKTKELFLYGNKDCTESHPLSDAAFSQMSKMEKLQLENIRLDRVSSFPRLIETHMPQLRSLRISNCKISKEALESHGSVKLSGIKMRDSSRASFSFSRKSRATA